MNKVIIYWGPSNEFNKILPMENTTGLTEFVRKYDNAWNKGTIESFIDDNYEINLVAFSEEFSGVREHFIENFLNVLSLVEVDHLYIHNPPLSLYEKIQNRYSGLTETIYFNYPEITREKVVQLKKGIVDGIIGQERAKAEILTSLYTLARRKNSKPLILMFYGPSGVGKTETAKYISSILDVPLFRKQLSMFQTNDFYSYLFGSSNDKMSFSKDLLERKSNIILLDEFDKVQPILFSAFYQMFDEGEFVDKTYSVKLNKSIIICTSNYTSRNEIRQNLGDPIYYRFDNLIKFDPLSKEQKKEIVIEQYNKQIENLDEHEKKAVEKGRILNIVMGNIDNFNNFRDIEKSIESIISAFLLQEIVE